MKKQITITMLCLIFIAGCGSAAPLGIGAGAGFAASETLKGIEADLQKVKEVKLTELEQSLEQLASATDEVEKVALMAKIKAYEKTIQDLQDAQQGVQLVAEGTKTDWSDPEAIGGYGGMVLASLLAWYFRRKGITSDKKYTAHKQGIEKTAIELDKDLELKLYENIGDARANLGI